MNESEYVKGIIEKFKQQDLYLLSFKIGREVVSLGCFTSFGKALVYGADYRKEHKLRVYPDIKKIKIIE